MLGMRTCRPCHIPDRWSRGANALSQISPLASSPRDLGTRLTLVHEGRPVLKLWKSPGAESTVKKVTYRQSFLMNCIL